MGPFVTSWGTLGSACFMALMVLGCGSRPGSQNNLDATTQNTDTTPAVSPDPTKAPWFFHAGESSAKDKVIALRTEKIEGNSVQLAVVGRNIPQIRGIAFRLTYAKKSVVLKDKKLGSAWSKVSPNTVHKMTVRSEGELWAGAAFKNTNTIDATKEIVLAELTLELKPPGPIEVDFRPFHNMILDQEGKTVRVAWVGGMFSQAPPPGR